MIVIRAFLALLAAAFATHAAAGSAKPAFFVSIDGLNPTLLEALVAAEALDAPRGLGWLRAEGLVVERARPIVTTLTAPSHVSTITCTPPSRHGVVSNTFLSGGVRVSGFTAPFRTEPLWRAAMRQGKRVLSLAYVGSDGTAPERTADWGLAYPDDSLMGRTQALSLELAALPAASGWTLPEGLGAPSLALKETTLAVVLNPKTQEERRLNALVAVERGAVRWVRIDTDKDLTNGDVGALDPVSAPTRRLDAFFVETAPGSTLPGAKRRVFVRLLPDQAGRLGLYVSKASYNNAYPASFRAALDAADLVWPDYGVRFDALPLDDYLEAQSMIDRFLTEVAERMVPALAPDVVLFYQPLVDTVGHKLQSALPLPFDPQADDAVTRTFRDAFRIVDGNVSRLLALGGKTPTVALMGDHGMDPSRKVVNLAKVLGPEHVGRIDVVTSGSLALVYATRDASHYGAELKSKLEGLLFEGAPVLGKAFEKNDATQADWSYGDATYAFTSAAGLYWSYAPFAEELFQAPSALGMHGHAPDLPAMATTLLFHAPGLQAATIPHGSLIDAVPTFSQLVGIAPPRDCEGRSLLD